MLMIVCTVDKRQNPSDDQKNIKIQKTDKFPFKIDLSKITDNIIQKVGKIIPENQKNLNYQKTYKFPFSLNLSEITGKIIQTVQNHLNQQKIRESPRIAVELSRIIGIVVFL